MHPGNGGKGEAVMDGLDQRRRSGRRALTAFLLLAVWTAGPAWTAGSEREPLQELRAVLENTSQDLQTRNQNTRDCIESLVSLVDLYQAALLPVWRDQHPDYEIAEVDRINRHDLMDRFTQATRNALHRRDPVAVGSMADLISRLARSAGTNGPPGLLRQFGPDLAAVARHGPVEARPAAARALGRIETDADTAAPALEQVLASDSLEARRAAATALAELLRATARDDAGIQNHEERVRIVRSVARLLIALQRALEDGDAQVRRQGVASVGLAAVTLSRLLTDPKGPECGETPLTAAEVIKERQTLRPLLLALRGQVLALSQALGDSDAAVCLEAQQTLEEIARVHGICQRQVQAFVPVLDLEDPLRQELEASVPRIATTLADGDVRMRRAAVGVLEILGPAAKAAIPTLVAALRDPDPCVRWSAVRSLDRLGEKGLRPALPALSRLLRDRDADVRAAVVVALGHLEEPAKLNGVVQSGYPPAERASGPPIPVLLESYQTGPVALKVASLRLLGQRGKEAIPVLPVLCQALNDSDAQVRRTAAEALGTLGPLARNAASDLRRALDDPVEDVRLAVDKALLRIVRISH